MQPPTMLKQSSAKNAKLFRARRKGPRYDKNYVPERIDEVENLILLCGVHHKMVEDRSKTSAAEILRKLKANHEAWVRTSLAEERGTPPLRLRRVKKYLPIFCVSPAAAKF